MLRKYISQIQIFFLVKMKHHKEVFDYLIAIKIVIRDRSNQKLCEGCLRITVGKLKKMML